MSSQNPSYNPTGYLGTNFTDPGQNFFERRDPLPTDIHFPIGARWINTVSNSFWVLGSVVNKVANWIVCGGATVAVQALLTDDTNLVSPIAGVITLAGDAGQGVSTSRPVAGIAAITVADAAPAQKGVVDVTSSPNTVLLGGATTADITSTTFTFPSTTAAGEMLLSNATNTVTSGNSLTGDFTFTNATAGAPRILHVTHTDNTNPGSDAMVNTSVGGTSGGDAKFQVIIPGGATWTLGADNSDADSFVLAQNASLGTNNVFKSVQSGILSFPLQSSCSVYASANVANATGDLTYYTIVFDTVEWDIHSEYNTGTGVFTASEPGIYLVTAVVGLYNIGAAHTIGNLQFTKSSVGWWQSQYNPAATAEAASQLSVVGSIQLKLAATETITCAVVVGGGTKTVGILGGTTVHTQMQITKIA